MELQQIEDYHNCIREALIKSYVKGISIRFTKYFITTFITIMAVYLLLEIIFFKHIYNPSTFKVVSINILLSIMFSLIYCSKYFKLHHELKNRSFDKNNNNIYNHLKRIEDIDSTHARVCLFNLGFDDKYSTLSPFKKFEKIAGYKPHYFWSKRMYIKSDITGKKCLINPLKIFDTLLCNSFFKEEFKVNYLYCMNSSLSYEDTLINSINPDTVMHTEDDRYFKKGIFRLAILSSLALIVVGEVIISEL